MQRALQAAPAFQEESGLGALSFQGFLTRTVSAGKSAVSGRFEYESFFVNGVGEVKAEIAVSPKAGGGAILLKLQLPDLVANVLLRWDSRGSSYIVNGTQILDEKTFQQLFSSFELVELLDRVKKMM